MLEFANWLNVSRKLDCLTEFKSSPINIGWLYLRDVEAYLGVPSHVSPDQQGILFHDGGGTVPITVYTGEANKELILRRRMLNQYLRDVGIPEWTE